MTQHLLALLAGFIAHVISTTGYGGIVLLMAIESACIPLPSELVLPFAGYLVATGRFDLIWVALVGALGCNLGSAVAYAVGAYGGRPLAERYGRWVLLRPSDLALADRWFRRFGDGTIFIARMLPVVRTFIALPAGVARMRGWRFHLYTFLGSLPWCWFMAYLGMRLGRRWLSLRPYLHRFDVVILAFIALGLGWFIARHWPRAEPPTRVLCGDGREDASTERGGAAL